ncbi:MAG: hypothetical protein UT58_C0040G0007, partial [Microgenomates group bacterium GW2011_GWC1_39_7b]
LLDYDCTKVDCIDATGTSVTIRTKDKTELLCPWGQKPKGIPLYKYFEPSLIQAKTPPLEIVYLAGLEADDEQKVVAQNYIARGEAKGEKRSLNYYSGFSYGYRFGQNGMYFEVLAQQRFQMDGTTCGKRPSYGVRSFNPSLGQVLYIGTIGKRPHEWKDELEALIDLEISLVRAFGWSLRDIDKTYIERTKHVLKRMREEGIISKKQAEEAGREIEQFKFTQKQGNLKAPHFMQYVREQLVKLYGESMVENGNLTVTTTLDYEIQKNAEDIVNSEVVKLADFKVGNGSAIVMDPKNGAILSMVGSRDYFDMDREGNFNAAVALRQPGSSLKPIMYATAFEKGYSPSTLVMDLRTEFPTNVPGQPDYKPENYDGKYRGPMQIRFALGNSINVPAVKMLARVGIKPVMQKAYEMGIDNWKPTSKNLENVGLSLVLGGREASLLQITTVYSSFAAQGVKREPFAIAEVKDGKGKIIYKHKESQGEKVLSPEVAFIISHILLDDNARSEVFGRYSLLNIPGKTVAVKTGTTDNKRDNWAVGYTPSYVVGAWVGNNDNTQMNPRIASGVTGATPIWNKIMQVVLKGKKDEQFSKPDGVVAIEIDSFSGGLPRDGQVKRTEYFMKGTEPTTNSIIYKKVKISKHQDGKLANEEEIERGDYDVKEFVVFEESDPVSRDGKNRWQEAINAWLNEAHRDDSAYRLPTELSDYEYDSEENKTPTSTPAPTGAAPTPTPTFSPTPSL